MTAGEEEEEAAGGGRGGAEFVVAVVRFPAVDVDVAIGAGAGTDAGSEEAPNRRETKKSEHVKKTRIGFTRHTSGIVSIGASTKEMCFNFSIIQLNLRNHITRHVTRATIFSFTDVKSIRILITIDLNDDVQSKRPISTRSIGRFLLVLIDFL